MFEQSSSPKKATTTASVEGKTFGNSTARNGTVASLYSSPVPFYGTILISVFCILVFICCIVCACMFICSGGKKKEKKSRKSIAMPRPSIHFDREHVQPDMDELIDKDEAKDDNFCGKLHYSLEYNVNNATLTVTVIECRQLTAMDVTGSSDPYVRLRLLPKQKPVFNTKQKRKTCDPLFDETFTFENVLSSDVTKRTLTFHVYDYDVVGKDDLIGHVALPLNGVDLSRDVIDEWVDLIKPGENSDQQASLGDVCLSLRYVPARGLLTVVVLEAKNIPRDEGGSDPDTFVALSIVKDRRKLKTKRTTVRKSSANPYFNETFTFEVPLTHVKTITLRAAVKVPTLAGLSGRTIGQVELSAQSGGPHWSAMLNSPRHPVARWHALQQPGEQDKDQDRAQEPAP